MHERGARVFLSGINEAIERISDYIDEITYDEFLQKTIVQERKVDSILEEEN